MALLTVEPSAAPSAALGAVSFGAALPSFENGNVDTSYNPASAVKDSTNLNWRLCHMFEGL